MLALGLTPLQIRRIENHSDTFAKWCKTATSRKHRLPSPSAGEGCGVGGPKSSSGVPKSVVTILCISKSNVAVAHSAVVWPSATFFPDTRIAVDLPECVGGSHYKVVLNRVSHASN